MRKFFKLSIISVLLVIGNNLFTILFIVHIRCMRTNIFKEKILETFEHT